MNHIDLFSGIGGFAYAAKCVWGGKYRNILFCDNNRFCQEVIKKNFGKDSVIYGDIRQVTKERFVADTNSGGLEGATTKRWNSINAVGKDSTITNTTTERLLHKENEQVLEGKGSDKLDIGKSRSLGDDVANSESKRRNNGVTKDIRQTTQQINSSSNEIGLPQIDLLTGGFPCQPFSCAGKRQGTDDNRHLWPEMFRVIQEFKPTWVVAENVRGLLTINKGLVFEQVCLDLEGEGYDVQPFIIPAVAKNAPHRRDRVWFVANRKGTGARENECGIRSVSDGHIDGEQNITNPNNGRCCGNIVGGESAGRESTDNTESWNQNWIEVATEFCRVDAGLSVELDGFKLSKAGHRVERLKALGNAIVPQVAMEIFKAILVAEETIKNEKGN